MKTTKAELLERAVELVNQAGNKLLEAKRLSESASEDNADAQALLDEFEEKVYD